MLVCCGASSLWKTEIADISRLRNQSDTSLEVTEEIKNQILHDEHKSVRRE